jgi:hypothetical protein
VTTSLKLQGISASRRFPSAPRWPRQKKFVKLVGELLGIAVICFSMYMGGWGLHRVPRRIRLCCVCFEAKVRVLALGRC